MHVGFFFTGALDFFEHAGIGESDRGLRRHRLQQQQILGAEISVDAVQKLDHANSLVRSRANGRAQNIACAVASFAVHVRIEARVGVGIRNQNRQAGSEDGTGNAGGVGNPNLAVF